MFNYSINAKSAKKINRELVLKNIYRNKPVSRADISSMTGLTRASITKIVDEFLKLGLVRDIGRTKVNYGRRPILLDISSDQFYIIGIFIGRKSISGIISNLNAEVKLKIVHKDGCLDLTDICSRVTNLINQLLNDSTIDIKKIIGIGIAVAGPINAKKGEIISKRISEKPPYNWSRIPLKETITKEFNLPVFTENCANASSLGESWFGNGINYKNFGLICFGEGVGGGLILDDRLYSGKDDVVAEVGHITIDINGPECECGNLGCLELFVNNDAIMKNYHDLIKKYPGSSLAKKRVKKVEDIYNFPEKDDPIFSSIIDNQAKYLAMGVINFINTLNPEAIIIATVELEDIEMDILIEKIKEVVEKRAYPVVRDSITIVPSKLKSNVQLVGSISLVLGGFFELDKVRFDSGHYSKIKIDSLK